MNPHPYKRLPDAKFWTRLVSPSPWSTLQLNDAPKFRLRPEDKVATAGSCFAQHIARYMRLAGLRTFNAEPPHPLMAALGHDVSSHEQFSARYGNVYTARQCLELFEQAFGERPVIDDFVESDGRWFDLMRPGVEKGGFATLVDARADRDYHIRCVKTLFERCDVFVLTLGLTESWYHAGQGHTYPVCPGTVKGEFDPQAHRFRNFRCSEVSTDLHRLVDGLRRVNPSARLVLTVSPVPLVATYTAHNVLVASAYSKAALRAAAGEISDSYEHVAYFPSFEIISQPASFGQYLASDLREVSERGVSHVMRCFLSSFYGELSAAQAQDPEPAKACAWEVAPPPECEEMFNAR